MVWFALVAVVSLVGGLGCAWAWLTFHDRFRRSPTLLLPEPKISTVSEARPSPPPARDHDRRASDGLLRLDPLLILRQSVDAVRPLADRARVTLLTPEPTGGFAVQARSDALAEAFGILLDNAVRHNRPQGIALVEIRQTRQGVAVHVHDTGPGLEPEALAALFQAPSEAPRGVPRARRLARVMGGRLTAASTPGQGSTFVLTLPSAPATERRASRLPARHPDLAGKTLLYIDPDPVSVALMRQVAAALGAALHVAATGRDGLVAARDLRPDVILMEPALPDMDGRDLKARLDAGALSRAPVVGVAADPDPVLARRGRQAGFAGWLTKPVDIALLTRTLARVASERPRGRPDCTLSGERA